MTKLKGVVIGAGYFSHFHFDAWSRIDEVEITAVCDLNSDSADKAASKFGIPKVYSDASEMLQQEKPDFVDIITRPDTHLDLVSQVAQHGCAIICQKPVAPTFEESKSLVDVSNDAGVRLMIHENFRFQPWYREIKMLLDQNTIGDKLHSIIIRTRTGDGWPADAYLARQPYFRTMPKLLVFETGVHFIDTMRYLGGEIAGVYASLRTLNQDIIGEDAGMLHLEFANGATGLWDANRFNESNSENPRYTFGETLVEGNGGSIRVYSDGRLTIQKLGEPEREHEYSPPEINFGGDCVYQTQKHFILGLLPQTPFETSGDDYLKTLKVQEAVYESAETKMPVRGRITGAGQCE